MPVSITWATKVIHVPQSFHTFVGTDPGGFDVYDFDTNAFRLELKGLEASEEGMPFLDSHRHNTTVTVGSITLARVIEIINGYTVEFEDTGTNYAVNFQGSNNNIADVAIVNRVSLRPQNSAGLVDTGVLDAMTALIERTQYLVESQRKSHSSMGGMVFYWDAVNGLDTNSGITAALACKTFAHVHDNLVVSGRHDVIMVVPTGATGAVTITERINISKNYVFVRGPGRDVVIDPLDDAADTVVITGVGVEFDSMRVTGGPGPIQRNAITVTGGAEFAKLSNLWVEDVGGSNRGLNIVGGDRHRLDDIQITGYQTAAYIDNVSYMFATNVFIFNGGNGLIMRATDGPGSATNNVIQNSVAARNTIDLDVGVDVEDTVFMYGSVASDVTNIVNNGTRTVVARFASEDRIAQKVWVKDSAGVEFDPDLFPGGIGVKLLSDLYAGAVWIDTGNGTPGSALGVNGTPGNPVNNMADAMLLNAKLGFRAFGIRKTSGGPLTLLVAHDDWRFFGIGGEVTIDLNGQDVDGSLFEGIELSGALNGTIRANACRIDGVTEIDGTFIGCWFLNGAVMPVAGGGELMCIGCASAVAGPGGTPSFDVAGGTNNTYHLRGWKGGIEILNSTMASNIGSIDMVAGQVILGPTNTGGTVTVRGVGNLTDTSAGLTVEQNAFLNRSAIADAVHDDNSNVVIDSQTYNVLGRMLTARRRVYSDNTLTTVLRTLDVTVTYAANNKDIVDYREVEQ